MSSHSSPELEYEVHYDVGNNRARIRNSLTKEVVEIAQLQYDISKLTKDQLQVLAESLINSAYRKQNIPKDFSVVSSQFHDHQGEIAESIARLINQVPSTDQLSALVLVLRFMQGIRRSLKRIDESISGSDSEMVAWQSRNIYEAYLWITYLLSAPEQQVPKFIGYVVFDQNEIFDGFSSFRRRLVPSTPEEEELFNLQIEGQKNRCIEEGRQYGAVSASGVIRTKNLASFADWLELRKAKELVRGKQPSEVSDAVLRRCMEAELSYKADPSAWSANTFWQTQKFHVLLDYEAFFKMASKFVHPSAFSIGANFAVDADSIEAFKVTLSFKALEYARKSRDLFRLPVHSRELEMPAIDPELPLYPHRNL